jgi:hypothetical protein
LKSFQATGIWPKEPVEVLSRFQSNSPEPEQLPPVDEMDWRKLRGLVQSVVKPGAEKEAKKLTDLLHRKQVKVELLEHENKGLREAVLLKKKHKNKSKTLPLQQEGEYHGGAVIWSPKKVKEAFERQVVKDQEKEEEQLQKAQAKATKAANKLYKLQIAEEKRVAKEVAKKEREKVRAQEAEQKAERERLKHLKKAQTQPQKQPKQGKKRASSTASKSAPKKPRKVVAEVVQEEEATPAPPPKLSSRGRTLNPKKQFG